MNNKKLLVLILSTRNPLYNEFKNTLKDTWVKRLQAKGVQCFFYEGGHNSNEIIGSDIYLKSNDDLRSTSEKFKSALKLMKSNGIEFDLIYRTNLSSYIDCETFLRFSNEIDNPLQAYAGKKVIFNILYEKLYSNYSSLIFCLNSTWLVKVLKSKILTTSMGYIRRFLINNFSKHNFEFASGSGFFLGRELADKVMNSDDFNMFIDDVMVRLVIGPVRCIDIDRFDVTYDYKTISIKSYNKRVVNGLFHYRFKTKNRILDSTLLRLADNDSSRKVLLFGNVSDK